MSQECDPLLPLSQTLQNSLESRTKLCPGCQDLSTTACIQTWPDQIEDLLSLQGKELSGMSNPPSPYLAGQVLFSVPQLTSY